MYYDSRDLEYEIMKHTDQNEKILWTGRPKQGLTLNGSDVFMIPFSLMWGGFAFFWEFTVLNSGGPIFFMLWGIPFVLIGVYLIIGRFFVDSQRRKNTIYAITQDRIIIKSGIMKRSIVSISIKTLVGISISEKADGSGTILLAPEINSSAAFRGTAWPGAVSKMTPAFEMIPEAIKVYKQIADLQKEHRGS